MLIGYARISPIDQNLSLQKDALVKAGCEKFFEDTISGAKASRPGLDEIMNFARKGDVIVIWRLDRLGRSLKNLIELVNQLDERGIGLQSLQESINTTTSAGKLIFHVFGALAFERKRLEGLIQKYITTAGKESLKKLLINESGLYEFNMHNSPIDMTQIV